MRNTEEAATYVDKGDYVKAEERLKLAIKEIRPFLPDTQRIMARSYCELARVLYHQKRYAEAEPLARWALSVREADKKAKPDSVFQCVYTLALIQSAQKQHGEAEAAPQAVARTSGKEPGARPHQQHSPPESTRDRLRRAGEIRRRRSLYLRSIAIHERKTPDENLDLAETAEKYAALLRRMKARRRGRPMACPRPGDPRHRRDQGGQSQGRSVQKDFQGFK